MQVRFEQAVYGSFPFWDRGYGILARSPGCRPEWIAALKRASQRYGERPAGAVEAAALFAMPLAHGPWMIVGVSPQGCDDQGRPGALAFHAVFVHRWTYARAGADPFAFADLLRADWGATDRDGSLSCGPCRLPGMGLCERGNRVRSSDDPGAPIVQALTEGRRVVVHASRPIEDLARGVWSALPWRVRLRASVATWAFGDANPFDLAAFPKLTGIRRERTDLVLDTVDCRG